MTVKFKKEDLVDEMFEVIEDEIIDQSRWSVHHRQVFKHEGKFYETYYSCGATEQQEEYPYENDPDE